MKPTALPILLVLAALACVTGPALAQPKETPLVAATINGPSEVLKKGSNTWVKAKLRDEVGEGDGARAMVGGRLVLRTTSGHAIRLAQLSQIFLSEAPAEASASDRTVRIKQDGGWIWVAVLPLSVTRAAFEVEAGPVTVAARSGGTGIRVSPDGSVLVRVFHGLALARASGEGAKWERTVKAGEELLVPATGRPAANRPITKEESEAGWIRWNEQQDMAGYGMPEPK
ncbi:MAG TPA: hypothetical protein VIX40_10710 [Methylomirabilota bacterium]